MRSRLWSPRVCRLLLVVALAVAPAAAQEIANPPQRVAAAGERWLSSDHTDRQFLNDTVKVLLADQEAGIAWLAGQLLDAARDPTSPRSKGTHTLATHLTLEFLRRTYAADMTYVGQYAPLLPLQPFVGRLLFDLLLDTPQWYPLTFRVRIVPALRDLQIEVPPEQVLQGVLQLAEEELEPLDLRRALAAMLWQWGVREPAARFLAELRQAAADGDLEDRVRTSLDLAAYLSLLRDYRGAGQAYLTALALAKDADVQLLPIAHYSAACAYALAGDVEQGIAALQRCAQALASPDLDSSLRLKRVLFEQDPELDSLRKDPRFAALVERAFGAVEPVRGR